MTDKTMSGGLSRRTLLQAAGAAAAGAVAVGMTSSSAEAAPMLKPFQPRGRLRRRGLLGCWRLLRGRLWCGDLLRCRGRRRSRRYLGRRIDAGLRGGSPSRVGRRRGSRSTGGVTHRDGIGRRGVNRRGVGRKGGRGLGVHLLGLHRQIHVLAELRLICAAAADAHAGSTFTAGHRSAVGQGHGGMAAVLTDHHRVGRSAVVKSAGQ